MGPKYFILQANGNLAMEACMIEPIKQKNEDDRAVPKSLYESRNKKFI